MDPYKKVVVTVAQLNGYTKTILEGNELLSDIYVRGELSNFKIYSSGHMYFSLKDIGLTPEAGLALYSGKADVPTVNKLLEDEKFHCTPILKRCDCGNGHIDQRIK